MNSQQWLDISLATAAAGFGFAWLRLLIQKRRFIQRLASKQADHRALLLELPGDWLWEQDPSGRFTSIELKSVDGRETEHRVSLTAFKQHTFWDIPGLKVLSSSMDELKQRMLHNAPYDRIVLSYVSASGDQLCIEATGRPIGKGGTPLGYRGCFLDVSHKVIAERLLHSERLFLQGLLLSVPIKELLSQLMPAIKNAVSVCSEAAIWIKANSSQADTLEFLACSNRALYPKKNYLKLLPTSLMNEGKSLSTLVLESVEENEPMIIEREFSSRLWTIHTNRESASEAAKELFGVTYCFPIVDVANNLIALLCLPLAATLTLSSDDCGRVEDVCRLITLGLERSRFENELHELNQGLEHRVQERTAELLELNGELEAYSYTVSHDLRAPLRAIYGFSDILLSEHGDDLSTKGRELVSKVRGNAKEMGQLIDGLLELSRLHRAKLSLLRVCHQNLVERAIDQLAIPKTTEVVIKTLPDSFGDPILLYQVWVNLIENAVKFTRNALSPRLEISARTIGSKVVEYAVCDNGVGFDMQSNERLFKPFERLHTVSEFEGTGIGLATVKKIVERHGGTIKALAKKGSGASFYFQLPLGQ